MIIVVECQESVRDKSGTHLCNKFEITVCTLLILIFWEQVTIMTTNNNFWSFIMHFRSFNVKSALENLILNIITNIINRLPLLFVAHNPYPNLKFDIILGLAGQKRFTGTSKFCFALLCRNHRDMNDWIEAINLVAATYSSPPLPAPVGSWYVNRVSDMVSLSVTAPFQTSCFQLLGGNNPGA